MREFRSSLAALAALLAGACSSGVRTQQQHASILVDPLSLDFGAQKPGASSKLKLTISNSGARTITILSSGIQGDLRSAFSAETLPNELGAGAQVQIEVTYSAATEGTDAAALVVQNDSDNSAELSVPLGGRTLAACADGQLECDGVCKDPLRDAQNCGGCGRACDATQICVNGACACRPKTCPAGACGQIDDSCGGLADCGNCSGQAECLQNLCIQPTCSDSRKNGNETDVDCGGGACPACGAGKGCVNTTDCQSHLDCTANLCGLVTPTGLAVAPAGIGQLQLSWTASANADIFSVQRSGDGQNFADVGTSSTTGFTDRALDNGAQYTYRVRASNTLAQSGFSATASGITLLPPPTGLAVSGTVARKLTVSWTGTPNATGYTVFRSSDAGATYTGVGTTTDPAWTITDTGLADGTIYFYEVQAARGAVLSDRSAPASGITAPAAPAGLTATGFTGSVSLNWTAPAGAASYSVWRSTASGTGYTMLASCSTPSTTDTTTLAGGTYFYVVTATNAGGTSGNSAEASNTRAPAAPNDVSASVSGQTVTLSWTAPAGATSFGVFRSATSGGGYVSIGATATGSVTDNAPDAGVAFYYVVTASNSGGTSDESPEVRAVTALPAPTSVVVTQAGAGKLKITWIGANHSDSYLVQRSLDGATFTDIANLGAQTYTDSGLDNAAAYTYRVRASNQLAQSAFSTPASGTTLLPAPTAVIVSGTTPRQLSVAWTGTTNATAYTVFRSDDGGSTYAAAGTTADPTVTFGDSGLQDGKVYFYEVQASRGTVLSARSAPGSSITAPAAPASLGATAGSSSVALSWSATAGAESYTVYRGAGTGGPYTVLATTDSNTATDTAPLRGSTYFYVVTASNEGGTSGYSNEATATLVPTAPTNPSATGGASIALAWTAPNGASGFRVRRAGASGGPYTTVGSPASSPFTDSSGLTPGVRYFYVIAATNAGGVGPDSVEVSAVTSLDVPGGLSAAGGARQIALAWNSVTGATSYVILRSDDGGANYTQLSTTSGTQSTDTNLANGSRHFYEVKAKTSDSLSAASAPASAITSLPAPTHLTAAGGKNTVQLNWSTVTDATGYNIYRSASSGGAYTQIGQSAGGSATDTSLADGVRAFYVVTATTSAAESPYSNEAAGVTTLPAAASLSATGGNKSVALSWTPVSAATGYSVYRDSPGARTLITTITAPTASASDTGLANGTAYSYEVIAFDDAATASATGPVSASTNMPAPGQPSATGGIKQISLSWGAVDDASGYLVSRSATPTGTYQFLASTTQPSYADGGLANGATWYYEVRAIGADVTSGNSLSASATTRRPDPAQANSTLTSSPTSAVANGSDAFQFTLTVRDGDNVPVANTSVSFSSDGSNNTLTAAAVTDSNGQIVAALQSTKAESKSVTAAVGSFFSLSTPVTFVAGTPAKVVFTRQPSSIVAGASMSPSVEVSVLDAFNNLTTYAGQVTLAVGGQTVLGSVAAASGGVATFGSVSLQTAGTYSMTASAGSITSVSSAAFTVSAAGLAKLVFVQAPGNVQAGAAFSPIVSVAEHDQFDNLVPGSDTITVSAAGATLTGASAVAVQGVATFGSLTVQTAGTFNMNAASGNASGGPTAQFTVSAAGPSQVTFVQQPTGAVAGAAIQPSVQVAVLDSFGNRTTYAGSVSLSTGGGASVTASAGLAAFPAFNIRTAGTYTVTASASSLTSAASNSFVITPDVLAKAVFIADPSNAVAGAAITPPVKVELRDQFDNKVNSTAHVALSASGAVLDAAGADAVAGVATFGSLSSETAGTFQLTAATGGITSAPSAQFTISAGTPASLAIAQQPSASVVGQPVSPSVQMKLLDQFGNLTSSSATVTLSVTGATISGASVQAVNGAATFTQFTVQTPGTFTLKGASGGLNSPNSASFTVFDVPPSNLQYSSNPAVYTNGVAIASNVPSSGGGAVTGWAITPALPAGLTFNTSTGVITGTPTGLSTTASYTVTASNSGGSLTATLVITVNDVAPSALAYSANPAVYTKGQTISDNTVSANGGPILSYAISPSLAATGLVFSTSTGAISGTPTVLLPLTTYTVTATNSGGSAQVTLSVTVNDVAPSGLSYAVNPAIYTRGQAIASDLPSSGGGPVVSYAVSPGLPAGLSLNTSSGAITGTPTALQTAATYTVTATNSGGFAQVTLTITVNDVAPSALSYSQNPLVASNGTAITNDVPTHGGGPVTGWTISPALSAGLFFNTSTGVVSGTPTAVAAATGYVVTASNTGGSVQVTLNITVNDVPPASLVYAHNPVVYTVGTAIAPNGPASGGGPVVSYAIAPALPTGLSINASSGVISGTPSVVAALATYTVTATNSGGFTQATLTITVNDIAPSAIVYTPNPASYTKGQPIATNTPTAGGGAVISWSIGAPFSNTGLTFDTTTGAISGTPTALSGATGYTVTATNSGGSAQVTLTITVKDVPPSNVQYASPAVYTEGTAIAPNTPSAGGGPVVSWSISPALPLGLTLSTSNGVISGTPAALQPATDYTVTATNSGGSAQGIVNITVNDVAPSALHYSANPAVYTLGHVITNDVPSASGGPITSYTISAGFSSTGLNFNTTTGVISGTPTVLQAATNYLVTANNSGGSASVILSIAINDVAPSSLAYSTNPASYTLGVTIAANSPLSAGGPVISYAISPALPAGLGMSTSTGIITGTPLALSAQADYTVTATNSGGFAQTTLTITVHDVAPSNLRYSPNPAIYTKGQLISDNTPANDGGPIVSYAISPSLGSIGLSFSTSSGIISGTPLALQTATVYTVTATNSGGTTQATVTITVNDVQPSNLVYSPASLVCTINVACSLAQPTVSGGPVVSYSISPALPNGLGINSTSGAISGTPSMLSAQASYTVTATNSGGTAQATVTVTVKDVAPSGLFYSPSTLTCTRASLCTSATPSATGGGPIISFAVTLGTLPAGLSINTSNGVISGTPSVISASQSYTVTGTNSGGSSAASITIFVKDIIPGGLTYAPNTLTCVKGSACNSPTPGQSSGGPITSFAVTTGTLPAGLSIDSGTGVISGTASVVSAAFTYTVTGTNTGGSTTASITINVNDVAPANLVYSPNTLNCTKGISCASATPGNTGGTIVTWGVSPTLPAGLSIGSTGVISGIPTALALSAPYTVTGTNTGGFTQGSITITVIDAAPIGLTYGINSTAAIVAPNLDATSEAAANFNIPFANSGHPIHSQTVFAASQFALSGPTPITKIAWRPNNDINFVGTPTTKSYSNVKVTLSTTSKTPGTLDTTFANNTGADATVVYNAAYSWTTAATVLGNGTMAFDITLTPTSAFTYNPAQGNLLMDIAVSNVSSDYQFDADDSGAAAATVFEFDLTSPASSHGVYTTALVTQLTFGSSALTCTINVPCSLGPPTNGGGAITAYTVSPGLPAGLSIDPDHGTISGTPTVLSSAAQYTITGSNTGGSTTTNVTVTVNDAAPTSLSYSSGLTCTKGSSCTSVTPTHSGGAITGYSISPALPTGLSIDAGTGVISGNPSVVSASQSYTVTAANSGGSTTASITIQVKDILPVPSYSPNTLTCMKGTLCTSATPSSSGGAVVTWSASSLPAGMGIASGTGVVSGTPTTVNTTATGYTITATNSGGQATTTLTITVNDALPVPSYSPSTLTCLKGSLCTSATPASSGGTVSTWSASSLPAGMSIASGTGVVSGTPTTVNTTATGYTITATNSGGQATTTLTITVNDALPVPSYSPNTLTCLKGTLCTSATPANSGGTGVTWSASSLPGGMSIASGTGVVSGTPTTVNTTATGYTITATNSGGQATTTLTITVNDALPVPSYSPNTLTCTQNVSCTSATPASSGGAVVTWSATTLPAGMSIASGTGIVSGTPTTAAGATGYTITATNSGGFATTTLTITVNSAFAADIGDVAVAFNNNSSMAKLHAADGSTFWTAAQDNCGAMAVDPLDFGVYVGTSVHCGTGATPRGAYKRNGATGALVWGNTNAANCNTCYFTGRGVAVDATSSSPGVYLTSDACSGSIAKISRTDGSQAWCQFTDDVYGPTIDNTNDGHFWVPTAEPNNSYRLLYGDTNAGSQTTAASCEGIIDINPADGTFYRGGNRNNRNPCGATTLQQLNKATLTGTITANWTMDVSASISNISNILVQPWSGGYVYLADSSTKKIAVVNPATQTVVRTFPVVAVDAMAVNPNGGNIYVASGSANFVYAYSPSGVLLWTSADLGSTISGLAAVRNTVGVAPAQWGALYADAQHSNRSSATAPTEAHLRWTVNGDSGAQTSSDCPLIGGDGTFYAHVYESGGVEGIASINPSTGTQNWFFKETNKTYGCPSIGLDGSLYLTAKSSANSDDVVEAIKSSGTLKWSATLSSGTWNGQGRIVVAPSGKLFATMPSGKTFQVTDAGTSGTVGWNFSTAKSQYYSALSNDGATIYVSTGSGNAGQDSFYAVRTSDGLQLAQYGPFGNQLNGQNLAVAPSGMLIAESIDPGYSINDFAQGFPAVTSVTASWNPTWTQTTHGWYWQPGAIATDGTFYPTRHIDGNAPYLWKINPDGTNPWIYQPSGTTIFNIVVIDAANHLFLGRGSSVIEIDPSTQTQIWSYSTASNVNALAIASDGTIFATTDGGANYALRKTTAPSSIAYSATLTCTRSSSCTSVTPTYSGDAVTSWSATGLPAGLSVNATGQVTGTPTAITASNSYTVTGTNAGGSANGSITIVVNDTLPVPSYSPNTLVCTKGTLCTSATPGNTGGAVVTWSAASLPPGMSIASGTGVVSGSPTTVNTTATGYTITATNTGGPATTTLTITVNDAVPIISYSPNTLTCTQNSSCSLGPPTNTGGAITGCSTTTGLPAGLTISSACTISGTPTGTQTATVYSVVATNSGGSSAGTSVTITINASASPPAGLSYSPSTLSCTQSSSCTSATPTSTGGAITSYAVTGTLPTGLSISSSTGVVSGTPTVLYPATTYTITASNGAGSTTASLTITVTNSAGLTEGDVVVGLNAQQVAKLKAVDGSQLWKVTQHHCYALGVDPLDLGVYGGSSTTISNAACGGAPTQNAIFKLDASTGSTASGNGWVKTGGTLQCAGCFYFIGSGVTVDATSSNPGVILTTTACSGSINKVSRTGADMWCQATNDVERPAVDATNNGQVYVVTGDSAGYDKLYSNTASGSQSVTSSYCEGFIDVNPVDGTFYRGGNATGHGCGATTLAQMSKTTPSSANWTMDVSSAISQINDVQVQPWSGGYVILSSYNDQKIAVVNPATQKVVTSFSTALRPNYMAINPNNGNIYVAGCTGSTSSCTGSDFVYAYGYGGNLTWTSADLGANVSGLGAPRAYPATTYPPASNSNTQLLLHFDEGSGTTTADASPNGYSITMPASSAWTSGGHFGSAMSLNGLNQFATAASTSNLHIAGSMTSEMWVYPTMSSLTMTGADPGMGLISDRTTNVPESYTFAIKNGGCLEFGANYTTHSGNGGWVLYSSCGVANYVQLNTWQHLAFTRTTSGNNAQIKIFYNGAKVVDQTCTDCGTASTSNGQGVEIGADVYYATYTSQGTFKGYIDDVRLLNTDLSEAQILADYQSSVH